MGHGTHRIHTVTVQTKRRTGRAKALIDQPPMGSEGGTGPEHDMALTPIPLSQVRLELKRVIGLFKSVLSSPVTEMVRYDRTLNFDGTLKSK